MKINDFFIALLGLFFIGCHSKKMSEETNFPYSMSVTSAKDYPIEVHVGYLATADKFLAPLPQGGGIEDDGWDVNGQEGASHGNIIPTKFSLTWVSYAEKKFWKVDDTLPSNKMLAIFKQGFLNIDRATHQQVHQTYDNIVVAVAPGGVVVVFLTGLWHRKEIGRFQAKEAFVDVNEFYDNPDKDNQQQFYDWWYNHNVPPNVKELIKAKGIPFGLWDAYRIHYNYKFRIQFYKDDNEDYRHVTYFNGEEDIIRGADLKSSEPKPLPHRVDFKFTEKWAETEFNDEELMNEFKELTKANKDEPIEIIGKVGFMYKGMSFIVKSKSKEIPLKQVLVAFWNRAKKINASNSNFKN